MYITYDELKALIIKLSNPKHAVDVDGLLPFTSLSAQVLIDLEDEGIITGVKDWVIMWGDDTYNTYKPKTLFFNIITLDRNVDKKHIPTFVTAKRIDSSYLGYGRRIPTKSRKD